MSVRKKNFQLRFLLQSDFCASLHEESALSLNIGSNIIRRLYANKRQNDEAVQHLSPEKCVSCWNWTVGQQGIWPNWCGRFLFLYLYVPIDRLIVRFFLFCLLLSLFFLFNCVLWVRKVFEKHSEEHWKWRRVSSFKQCKRELHGVSSIYWS